MTALLDPWHYTAEEIPEDDAEYTGPVMDWDALMAIAFPDGKLQEHFGPGPHKSGSPQSSHSKGGVERATRATIAGIEQGGSSVRTSGVTPSSGIMVSYSPESGHARVVGLNRPKAQIEAEVRDFVSKQREFVTSHSDRYIGGWADKGKLHLDVSQNFPTSRRDAAIRAGRQRNQIAVFDLDTFTDIQTGGTGA